MPPGALRRLLTPAPRPDARDDGLCEHLRVAPADAEPRTPEGCGECLQQGTSWVHLRLCLTCGHVGCCDTGAWRHADAHAHAAHHPVMRSVEPGETWRWCYVHQLLG